MPSFYARDWISLEQCSCAELFDTRVDIWQALAALPAYLQQRVSQSQIDATANIHPSAVIAEHVQIGPKVVIGPHVVIEDYVVIGAGSTLKTGCYVRSNSIIGEGCVIGHATEIKQSILLNTVRAPHFNYIGDSILGYGVHLGGGVMIANFKSDGTMVTVTADQERYPTGLRKFGALIGDDAEIGAGAILNPGSCIGRHTAIYPGSIIRGYVPANKIYKSKIGEVEIVDRR